MRAVIGAAALVAVSAVGSGSAIAQEHAHQDLADGPSVGTTRESSGTSWVPDATPMLGFHQRMRGWDVMVHGNAFGQFLLESGEDHHRGVQAGSINWVMGTASRSARGGRLSLRSMLSLEPWTIRGCGYPHLLATGEVCDGDTIHDRQHPHDVFMEMAAIYDRPLRGTLRWQVYGGPAGEPALGPPAFPHRLSSLPNPLSPITHHSLDASHISFGVVTSGVYNARWKVEGSLFNGREPDDRRADFDLGPLDSFSGRVSFAPTRALVLQVSAGHLEEGEAGVGRQPRTDVDRLTASAVYQHIQEGRVSTTTVAYGMNSKRAIIPGDLLDERTHAALLETGILVRDTHAVFGRVEIAGKPAHDLHAHEFATEVFVVGKIVGGYTRHFRPWKGLLPGIGAAGMLSVVPSPLAPRYRGRIAPGFGVFATVRPAEHRM